MTERAQGRSAHVSPSRREALLHAAGVRHWNRTTPLLYPALQPRPAIRRLRLFRLVSSLRPSLQAQLRTHSLALFIVVCLLGLYAYENMPSKDPTLREHADAANTTENGTTGFLMVLGFIVFGGLLIAHGLGLTSSDGPTMVMNGVPVQQSKESGISKTFRCVCPLFNAVRQLTEEHSIAATFIFFLGALHPNLLTFERDC